jgi:hypothetical protein
VRCLATLTWSNTYRIGTVGDHCDLFGGDRVILRDASTAELLAAVDRAIHTATPRHRPAQHRRRGLGQRRRWNRLEQVTATDNEQGVTLGETDRAVLTHSTLSRNADDLILVGDSNRIVGNVFTDAIGCGADCGGNGISLEAGSHNLMSGNRVLRTVHDGIRLADFLPEITTGHNVVEDNTVISAGNDGIAVATEGDGPVSDSTLRENRVIRSGQDGIHVATPNADLSGNRAVANGRYGINAVPGVHDGGGNRAMANGASPQCLNVTCA